MIASAAATHGHAWRASTSVSGSGLWRTPPAIYLPLDREFDFTLDVAADGANAKHVRYLTKDTDALAVSWAGERVFCNPPYGRALSAWVAKAQREAAEADALVVMLLPARTGTIWFHNLVLPYAEVRFIRGRLGFTLGAAGRGGRAPFDSMVVIFRPGGRLPEPGRAQLLFPFLPKAPVDEDSAGR